MIYDYVNKDEKHVFSSKYCVQRMSFTKKPRAHFCSNSCFQIQFRSKNNEPKWYLKEEFFFRDWKRSFKKRDIELWSRSPFDGLAISFTYILPSRDFGVLLKTTYPKAGMKPGNETTTNFQDASRNRRSPDDWNATSLFPPFLAWKLKTPD